MFAQEFEKTSGWKKNVAIGAGIAGLGAAGYGLKQNADDKLRKLKSQKPKNKKLWGSLSKGRGTIDNIDRHEMDLEYREKGGSYV